MKKRILSILLMSAMLLGMTGCNSGTEAPESTTTDSAEVAATTTAAKEDTVEATKEAVETEATTTTAKTEATTTTTTTTEEIVEEPVELPLVREIIYNYLPFYLSGTTTDNKPFVYNVAEKSVYIPDDDNELFMHYFRNHNCIIGNYALNTMPSEYVVITNYKSCDYGLNEFNKDNEYENFKVLDHTIMPTVVVGSKEDFSGKVNYYGVIDENGEWLLPMTPTEIDIAEIDYDRLLGEGTRIIKCTSEYIAYHTYNNKVNCFDLSVYFYKEDRTVTYDNWCIVDGIIRWPENGECFLVISLDEKGNRQAIRHNIRTGESEIISYEYFKIFFENYRKYRTYDNGVITVYKPNYSDFTFSTTEYNYDLSEYNGVSISEVNDNVVVFYADNPNGTSYRLIMKNDGTLIGEPVESKGLITYLFDDKILSITASGKDRSLKHEKQMIDIETGEVTDISADYVVYSVIENEDGSCKLLVKSDNAYYYVDPSDFETLINVFEGVENVYTVED